MESSSPIFVSIETSAFSGATLLAILLGAHPDITTIGEIHGLIARADPESYLCSCGKKIKECEFWKNIANTMRQKGYSFDVTSFNTKFKYNGPRFLYNIRHGSSRNYLIDFIRDKIVYALPWEQKILQKYAERNAAFVESVLEVTGNNIFVDSSKTKMLLRTFPRYTNFDVRAIHFIRRPEGVVASQIRRSKYPNAVKEAHHWIKRHRRIELSLKSMQVDKSIRIRYEDLCLDTENTLRKLFEFCNVSTNLTKLNYDVMAQHVIGNPMRLRPLSEITLDERWKEELSQDQIDLVRKITGKFSRNYGYEGF